MMKNEMKCVCPRCGYPLVSVHAVEGNRRRVIALTCPEPYCDHMQMLPSERAGRLEDRRPDGSPPLRRAN